MIKLRLSARAGAEIEQIRNRSVEQFGPAVAADFLTGFKRVFRLLREHPRIGVAHPEYGRGLRIFPHRPYRILYRVVGDSIVITRVIHQSRDMRRALRART